MAQKKKSQKPPAETRTEYLSTQDAADYLGSDPGEQKILAIADRNRAFFQQLVAS